MHAGLGPAGYGAARPRRHEAHGDGDRARRSTTRRWPTSICGVGTEESYHAHASVSPLEEGLLVGISSGAALAARLQIASTIEDGVIVMIFSDGGEKYLSERFWEEPPEGSFVSGVN